MKYEQARDFINSRPEQYLTIAKAPVRNKSTGLMEQSYICPFCGHGKNGDGMSFADATHLHCFGCGYTGDMVDLVAKDKGIEDGASLEALKKAMEVYGINEDTEYTAPTVPTAHTAYTAYTAPVEERTEEDILEVQEYLLSAYEDRDKTDYLQSRGISKGVAEKLGIGFDTALKVITIPYNRYEDNSIDYQQRYTEPQYDKEGNLKRYKYRTGSRAGLFNAKALSGTEPVFIVEGAIDAMSLIELGYSAVGLNSISNLRGFDKWIKNNRNKITAPELIISFDEDSNEETNSKCRAAEKALEDMLKAQNIKCSHDVVTLSNTTGCKDINELLQKDRAQLERNVKRIMEKMEAEKKAEQEKIKALYKQKSVGAHLQDFIDGITTDTPAISTGFKQLDEALEGGLTTGLYVIGAQSSVGKTSYCLQIADNLASSGRDVLFISMEQTKNELIAKSISRHTLIDVLTNKEKIAYAKTGKGITTKARYDNYCKEELMIIGRAINSYSQYAERLFIRDRQDNNYEQYSTEDISNAIQEHIDCTGNTPIVFVDYFQILKPAMDKSGRALSDLQSYTVNITNLKKISAQYNLPLIAISSLNRGGYGKDVENSSYKGSGDIEYSGDVNLGLQLTNAGTTAKEYREAMRGTDGVREVTLSILKQRNGATGVDINMKYYLMFNYLKEI